MVISLKFKRFPIWLLTLDSMQITEVYLMGFSTQDDSNPHVPTAEGFDQQLIDATISKVGASKVNFTTNNIPAAGLLYLVSGSKSFVQAWSKEAINLMMVLCDEHIQTTRRLHCQGKLHWMVLRHSTFRRVMHFQAMLGTNIHGFATVQTTLKRTICHVLEHSVKPRWAPAPSREPATATLPLKDRLHPVDLQREVVYHTHYSSTGWGLRSSSQDEVAIAFGWPSWARKSTPDPLKSLPCLPLQIMDCCLRGISSSCPRPYPLQTPSLPASPNSADVPLLPHLQTFLPSTWINSGLITD
jgi:hypothetical protein